MEGWRVTAFSLLMWRSRRDGDSGGGNEKEHLSVQVHVNLDEARTENTVEMDAVHPRRISTDLPWGAAFHICQLDSCNVFDVGQGIEDRKIKTTMLLLRGILFICSVHCQQDNSYHYFCLYHQLWTLRIHCEIMLLFFELNNYAHSRKGWGFKGLNWGFALSNLFPSLEK